MIRLLVGAGLLIAVVTLGAAWINRPTRGKYRREE